MLLVTGPNSQMLMRRPIPYLRYKHDSGRPYYIESTPLFRKVGHVMCAYRLRTPPEFHKIPVRFVLSASSESGYENC